MDFLLVHGSTQSPRGYDRLAAALAGRGHRTVALDLAGDRPEWTAAEYAGEARQSGLTEPVLVVHSAAGALAPAIAAATGARHIAWLAAVVPDPGRSVLDEAGADPGMFGTEWRTWTAGLEEEPAETAYFLFHDCDLETLRWALSTTRLWNPRTVFAATAPTTGLPPSTYVLPVEDRTLTPEWMRRVATERLDTDAIEVPGGHCPHVSRPEEVAALLDR
ncbi:MAG TPA: alpha/beta fold hydrolase [Mycobacteriales bacterium]|jgi:pimeloyl-ACP methyl ester carboxylesterase|nr:alpha/beta fold hydrolase [Mycobacteriales bacterium]